MTHYHPYHRRRTPLPSLPISTYLRRTPTLRRTRSVAKSPLLPPIQELDMTEENFRIRQSHGGDWSDSSFVSSFPPQQSHFPPSQEHGFTTKSTFSFARPTFNSRTSSQNSSFNLAPVAKSFPSFPSTLPQSGSGLTCSNSKLPVSTTGDVAATSAHKEGKTRLSTPARRDYKLPTSGCGVCATTDTAEWPRGPAGTRSLCNACGLAAARRARRREAGGEAHPDTIELIEEELEEIGFERFRPESGHYQPPTGSRRRILESQRRNRSSEALSRSSSASSNDIKMAAGALVKLTRRASLNSPPNSARPVRKELRRNSFDHPGFERRARYTSNASMDLPPSSTYLASRPSRQMTQTVPSIVVAEPQNSSTWFYSSQHRYHSTQVNSSHERSRIDGAYYPQPHFPSPDNSAQPRVVPYTRIYSPPVPLPTSSLNRIPLSRLTEPSYPTPYPRSSSIESYSLSAMAAKSNSPKPPLSSSSGYPRFTS
ncbi:hypothetical protein JCM5350_002410 [Sporobolomyces pararoseus]